jgi:hypothetical protein
MDNNGRPDLFLAVVYEDEQGRVQPLVLNNLSQKGGSLKFSEPPYEKMTGYYAPAPVGDFDRDGRLDIFLASWFENLPNRLYRNVTPGGNWLNVRVEGNGQDRNTQGIGAVVRIYTSGHASQPQHQLGRRDIAVGAGYASCEEAAAHFGLGDATTCDIEITWGAKKVQRTKVAANQTVSIAVEP